MASEDSIVPPLRAVPMALFPTADSLQSVIDQGKTQLPIDTNNKMVTLLMTYHNTLLSELDKPES